MNKMTKEQAPKKIEELKQYVDECDPESKEVCIEVKNRWTGEVEFTSTKKTIKEVVEDNKADLREADLREANLYGAGLRGADLQDAKFYGKGGTKPLKRSQLPYFLAALWFVIEEN